MTGIDGGTKQPEVSRELNAFESVLDHLFNDMKSLEDRLKGVLRSPFESDEEGDKDTVTMVPVAMKINSLSKRFLQIHDGLQNILRRIEV